MFTGGIIWLDVSNVSLVNTYLFPWFVTSCSLTDLWELSQFKVNIYTYNSLNPLKYSPNPNEGKSPTYKKRSNLQTESSPAIYTELECHFQNVTSLQSVSLSWSNKVKVNIVLKSGSSHHYMQKRVQSDLFQWWQEVGRPDVLTFWSSSRSWAGGRQSEWAHDSQTPSGRSPAGTARCTWGRFSSGSPRAPQTCSGHSWAGRWPRTADIASCPCCIRERDRRREKAGERKLVLISSEVMMWANQERRLIKSICLMRRGWPAAWLIPTKEGCAAEQTLYTCYNVQVWKTVGCSKLRRSLGTCRCVTWDQSRRQFVHRSQMGCGFQLLWVVRWYYPEKGR